MKDIFEIINVADEGVATQSSLSKWSEPTGAQALTKALNKEFTIHTAEEDEPWWELDLKNTFPICKIEIENRDNDKFQRRAEKLEVLISIDRCQWTVIHAGLSVFGTKRSNNPMVLEMGGVVDARYIRLQLPERGILHLRSISVLVRKSDHIISKFKSDMLRYVEFPASTNPQHQPNPSLVSIGNHESSSIIGLRVKKFGRMGNNFTQIANALFVAKSLCLKYIIAPPSPLGAGSTSIYDGIKLIPYDDASVEGVFVEDNFYYLRSKFPNSLDNIFRYKVSQGLVIPWLGLDHVSPKQGRDDVLMVHMRSGDIFSDNPHPAYIQPPLAFYKNIINDLIENGGIKKVHLVAEDRVNPCVNALEEWLSTKEIAHTFQSMSLREDLESLRQAKHVVYGTGTFGKGVSLIAGEISNIYAFGSPQQYVGLPNVINVIGYGDAMGEYIKPGEWRNTEEQRRLMLTYPEQNIKVVYSRRSNDLQGGNDT